MRAAIPSRFLRWVVFAAIVVLVAGVFATPALAAYGLQQPPPPPPVNAHPQQAVLNPLGIGLAIIFLILMVNLFRWMFRVPPQLPRVVVKARQSVSALHRILVPVTESVAAERAVELACRLGVAQKAEIVLLYVVEVPLTLSLNAPMAAEEAKGQEILQTARCTVEQHSLPLQMKIIPHRYVWGGILHLAREEMVDAIVMSVGTRRSGSPEGLGRTAQEVLKRAECEVILDRAPRRNPGVAPVMCR
jgi:nucleotide-binding universal stress UspA family protein